MCTSGTSTLRDPVALSVPTLSATRATHEHAGRTPVRHLGLVQRHHITHDSHSNGCLDRHLPQTFHQKNGWPAPKPPYSCLCHSHTPPASPYVLSTSEIRLNDLSPPTTQQLAKTLTLTMIAPLTNAVQPDAPTDAKVLSPRAWPKPQGPCPCEARDMPKYAKGMQAQRKLCKSYQIMAW